MYSTSENFYDACGDLIRPGERFHDGRGYLVQPGESFYDYRVRPVRSKLAA